MHYAYAQVHPREQELNDLALEIYRDMNRMFTPMYPWVFVRVLPRAQEIMGGLLVVPEHEQNKTVHEGIVLATWHPRTIRGTEVQSDLELGQHVLFPYWAGLPVWGYSDIQYRLVKEAKWRIDQEGGILGELTYGEKKSAPGEVLHEILADGLLWEDPGGMRELYAALTERFLLVDKQAHSVTLSGR